MNILLALILLPLPAVGGYTVMGRVDRFLDRKVHRE